MSQTTSLTSQISGKNTMTNQIKNSLSIFPFLFITILLTTTQFPRFSSAAKIHISDDLDDVIDDEEDDDWKNWGKKKATPSPEFEFHPSDLEKMEPSDIQAKMMKHHTGPLFGFVKLILGVQRTPDKVSEIAMKWSKVSKTGGLEVKFMGVDLSTIMFTMEAGQDMEELRQEQVNCDHDELESGSMFRIHSLQFRNFPSSLDVVTAKLKEFILEQPDAYEVKIGDVVYRRPGDPPLEEVIETLRKETDKVNSPAAEEHEKDEL
ncbi:Adenine phosphoribosyltransferase [Bienertia sinuspersici]